MTYSLSGTISETVITGRYAKPHPPTYTLNADNVTDGKFYDELSRFTGQFYPILISHTEQYVSSFIAYIQRAGIESERAAHGQ